MKKGNKNLLVPQCFSNLVSFKRAFTLAEVLITLGIIGVVAAITIPTLVANYNVKTWSTSANVFEKKLTQALRVMNTQMTLTGHETTKDFVEELSQRAKSIPAGMGEIAPQAEQRNRHSRVGEIHGAMRRG